MQDKEKIIIVTGGTGGLGRVVVDYLATQKKLQTLSSGLRCSGILKHLS